MIHVDEAMGGFTVWRSVNGSWQLVVSAPTRMVALVEAEHRIRRELSAVQELLHQAKQAEERARR